MGPNDELEDLVQEVFLNVQRAIARFRGNARFSTWLHRIAVNTAISALRNSQSVVDKVVTSIAMARLNPPRTPAMMPVPPIRGVGVLWDDRSFGMSRKPHLKAVRRAIGTTLMATIADTALQTTA